MESSGAGVVGARGHAIPNVFHTRETNQVRIFNPCFCTTASSLSATPLGRFAPVSHLSNACRRGEMRFAA
jgi:hypothetical protein